MRKMVFIALFFIGVISGCGPSITSENTSTTTPNPSPSAEKVSLSILSPHNLHIREVFEKAFSNYHQQHFGSPVKVEWGDQGGTVEMMKFIRSEYTRSPEGINYDILFGGGTEPYLELASQGHFEIHKVPDDLLARLPVDFGGIPLYAQDYSWYGAALSGFGIMYNKPLLEKEGLPAPKAWEDLADPKLMSWVGSADPRQSGSVRMTYEIILQAYGWEKGWDIITRLGGNIRRFSGAGGDVPKDIAAGDVACGMCIDLYAWSQIAETGGERLEFFFPEGLTVINPDGIAIFKGAPHKEIAERFIDFVLSSDGQKLWMLKVGDPEFPGSKPLYRMSVLPFLYDDLKDRSQLSINPFAAKTSLRFDVVKSRDRYLVLNDLLGALMVDTHNELTRAWTAIIEAGLPPEAMAELVSVPITEEEAVMLAKTQWSDDAFRNSKIAEWVKFAREKFARTEELAGK